MAFILLTFLLVIISPQVYRKITHQTDANAKCLDGSTPALYLHQADPTHILFYLQGGGTCGGSSLQQTLENCYQRSKTSYGSSLYWPETATEEGILSTDINQNIFANWTKVVVLYCDGAFHQGTTKDPLSYKDAKLYFRGGVNTRAHFQYIHNRFNLSKAEKVILTGSSAGGIAALSWSEYLKSFLKDADYRVIADSAILLRVDQDELQNIFRVSNVAEDMANSKCATLDKASWWRCLTFQGILPFVGTQTLFLQSAYDYFIISQRLYLSCLSQGEYGYSLQYCNEQERKKIEDYRNEYLNSFGIILSYNHLIWSIDCSIHSFINFDHFYYSPDLKVPMTSGRTMQEAIYTWIFEGVQVVQIDLVRWPNNAPCAF